MYFSLFELESLKCCHKVTLQMRLWDLYLEYTEDTQRPTGHFADEVKTRRRAGVPCSVPVRLSVNVPVRVIGHAARLTLAPSKLPHV